LTGVVSAEFANGFALFPGKLQPMAELNNPAAITPKAIRVTNMILTPTAKWHREAKQPHYGPHSRRILLIVPKCRKAYFSKMGWC
jgi:hypothetical protein